MRRWAFLSLGLLELLVAFILLALVRHLPSSGDVQGSAVRAEKVGKQTGEELRRLQSQLQTFRDRQPGLNQMTAQLQKNLDKVGKQLSHSHVDFKALESVSDALADAAMGMEGLAQALDPKALSQMVAALGSAATYLDDKVVPTATKAADQLERSTEQLKADAERLSELLRTLAEDPIAYQQALVQLEQADGSLAWLLERSTPERLAQWQDHLGRLRAQLVTASKQVSEISAQTYPVLSFHDLVPTVSYKPLWPEGKSVAHGMVQAGDMMRLIQGYLGWMADRTESYQTFLKEMRSALQQTSRVVDAARIRHAEMGPLFRDLPAHAARFAEELPRIGKELVRVLRDASRLKEVAVVLRQASMSLVRMLEAWPDMQKRLGQSAGVLRAVRKQLNHTLDHRQEYETALNQASVLMDSMATSLPVFTKQLEHDLTEQVESLSGLEKSINEVTATIPPAAQGASHIVQLTRLLLALLAGIFGLHACYLLHEAWTLAGSPARAAVVSAQPKHVEPPAVKATEQAGV